jgi:hypothetical protein
MPERELRPFFAMTQGSRQGMRLNLSQFSRRRLIAAAAGAITVAGAAVLIPVLPAFAAPGCTTAR